MSLPLQPTLLDRKAWRSRHLCRWKSYRWNRGAAVLSWPERPFRKMVSCLLGCDLLTSKSKMILAGPDTLSRGFIGMRGIRDLIQKANASSTLFVSPWRTKMPISKLSMVQLSMPPPILIREHGTWTYHYPNDSHQMTKYKQPVETTVLTGFMMTFWGSKESGTEMVIR